MTLAVLALEPLALWPLAETAGAVADNAEGTAALDGAYVGVTLADGAGPDGAEPAPLFDGSGSYVDVGSAALSAGFSGTAGTLAVWGRVAAGARWVDGVERVLVELAADDNNRICIRKTTVDYEIALEAVIGGMALTATAMTLTTGWFHAAVTWAKNGTGAVQAYLDGGQVGATQNTLSSWVGAPDAERCKIGARGAAGSNGWEGWLSHVAVWTRALAGAEVAALADV